MDDDAEVQYDYRHFCRSMPNLHGHGVVLHKLFHAHEILFVRHVMG